MMETYPYENCPIKNGFFWRLPLNVLPRHVSYLMTTWILRNTKFWCKLNTMINLRTSSQHQVTRNTAKSKWDLMIVQRTVNSFIICCINHNNSEKLIKSSSSGTLATVAHSISVHRAPSFSKYIIVIIVEDPLEWSAAHGSTQARK